ncbi:MAG: hypothetical protein ACRC37_01410 [Lentisphaeria bacterium]
MKNRVIIGAILGVFLVTAQGIAQEARARVPKLNMGPFTSSAKMEVNKLSAPDFTGVDKQKGLTTLFRKDKWTQLTCRLGEITGGAKSDTYVDNLKIKWEIYVPADTVNKRKALRIVKEIEYVEAPKNIASLPISLYIRPAILQRYFSGSVKLTDIAARITVSVNGEDLMKTPVVVSPSGKLPPANMWEAADDKFGDVANAEFIFLNKDETPFVHADTNDFLFINKEAK